ncbi:MAG TPA: molybdopterin converting factor subunit 1 [Chloroflexota bacterium]|nr:molybdopterin converting factor subunit 1 [Chloroflexota bacterium]
MQVRLRFFAAAREAMGQTATTLDLPDGSTVGDLRARLRAEHPAFAALPPDMMVSVNLEYRTPDYRLSDGDEVAFIPPVSGGAAGARRREDEACSRSPTRS